MLGTAVWALNPKPGIVVALTDLGRYLVRQRLRLRTPTYL
jgi:hypothetical protein